MTINLAVEHEFNLGGGGTITPRLNLNWQDEYEWAAETGNWLKNAPDSGCHQDSYSTLDARVTYRPGNGDWQVAAFGGNITDERYIEFCEAERNVWLWRLGRPAWWGIEFSAHFGRN
jgi:outer membrane receptor protein involved in Fe transport